MTSTYSNQMYQQYWQAVIKRDREADGSFYYGVKTTGIYCNPSCSSRKPNQNNVEFFRSTEEAERAGYRACKRCRPARTTSHTAQEKKIIEACRRMESSHHHLKLKELAAKAGLSPHHFHRLFRKITGVTPKQYSAAQQAKRYQQSLQSCNSVTEAIYDAGYSSSSRAYEKRNDRLAMQPRKYRQGGAGLTLTYGIAPCALGYLVVVTTEQGICAIEFADTPEILPELVQKRFPKASIRPADDSLSTLIEQVVEYIDSPTKKCHLPLDIQGTAFQQQVWEILREVEPGETLSYTEVAERIGKPEGVRAVAGAVAANKIGVIIPCHRIISKSGEISGYRWGIERKKELLQREKDNTRK